MKRRNRCLWLAGAGAFVRCGVVPGQAGRAQQAPAAIEITVLLPSPLHSLHTPSLLSLHTPLCVTPCYRKGYYDNADVAHELIPLMPGWGAAGVTLHGRTRQQRYSRAADWAYIRWVGAWRSVHCQVLSGERWHISVAASAWAQPPHYDLHCAVKCLVPPNPSSLPSPLLTPPHYPLCHTHKHNSRCAGIASSLGLPLIGNGDVFSPSEWQQRLAAAAAAGRSGHMLV